jgi:hypothetical protein
VVHSGFDYALLSDFQFPRRARSQSDSMHSQTQRRSTGMVFFLSANKKYSSIMWFIHHLLLGNFTSSFSYFSKVSLIWPSSYIFQHGFQATFSNLNFIPFL